MSEQVRLKVTLQVTPQTRGMSVRGSHVPRELSYNRVFTLHGGVKHYGPFLLTGAPDDGSGTDPVEGDHWFKVPLDGIDPTKLHALFIEFDDKYDDPSVFAALGKTFTEVQDSRAFGGLALRKGTYWTGGLAPITSDNGLRILLDKSVSLDLAGHNGIGDLDHHGLWEVGPVLLLNPAFADDECDLYVVITGGGSQAVSEYWGSASVTLIEMALGHEDLYATYPELI
jgi:hypothetical protein